MGGHCGPKSRVDGPNFEHCRLDTKFLQGFGHMGSELLSNEFSIQHLGLKGSVPVFL